MKVINVISNPDDKRDLREIRKNFFLSMYGMNQSKDIGHISKFNNSIGFKPVVDDWHHYPAIYPAAIDSPEDYTDPQSFLSLRFWPVFHDGRKVAMFLFEKGVERHPDKRFTYNHYRLCYKFIHYLNKIYPTFTFEIEDIPDSDFDPDIVYRIEKLFYGNLATADGPFITIECSSQEILDQEQLNRIYDDFSSIVPFKWHINQYFCETCQQQHPDAPYHTEIVYDI